MKNYQKSFLKLALESNSLQFGEFVLKSGRKSPYFFNAANMLNGSNLYELAKCYTDAIEETNLEFDSILNVFLKEVFCSERVAVLAKLGIIDCYRGRIIKLIRKSYIFFSLNSSHNNF